MLMHEERLTKQELWDLAVGIVSGQVFTDRHIRPEDYERTVLAVFMPLVFADEDMITEIGKEASLLYEWMDKAGPRSMNGYPMFFSVHWLHQDQQPQLDEFIDELFERRKEVGGDTDTAPGEREQVDTEGAGS